MAKMTKEIVQDVAEHINKMLNSIGGTMHIANVRESVRDHIGMYRIGNTNFERVIIYGVSTGYWMVDGDQIKAKPAEATMPEPKVEPKVEPKGVTTEQLLTLLPPLDHEEILSRTSPLPKAKKIYPTLHQILDLYLTAKEDWKGTNKANQLRASAIRKVLSLPASHFPIDGTLTYSEIERGIMNFMLDDGSLTPLTTASYVTRVMQVVRMAEFDGFITLAAEWLTRQPMAQAHG